MAAEVLNQPTQLASFLPQQQAPAGNDRSFLVKQEVRTPTDELTGLPLPILPTEYFTPGADLHHHFHPRRSPLLKDLGGQAVRCVRLQRVNYDTHHYDYHGNFYGPPLPTSVEEKFFTVLMALAYIPRQAIDFSADAPKVVDMTIAQRNRLQSPKHMRITGKKIIHDFISSHILEQDMHNLGLSDSLLDEFLNTRHPERRDELGHFILSLATGLATEPLESPYRQAHRERLILPGLPRTAQKFTKSQLGPRQARDKLIPQLHQQLLQAA